MDGHLRFIEELKHWLASLPVHSLPDFTKDFGIRMELRDRGGGVLFQK